jgi:4-aminobutyrate aminotransferase / (S)-3-amino-2-methylpropionate transaminase / 5-aminovalerate transaminase
MATIHLQTELPGPNSRALVARREAATPRGAAKLTQIAVARAEGAAVHDVDGNTLLDFAGGIGVLAVGHCPPNVVQAMQAQAQEMIHLCAIVGTYEAYVRTAELLNEVAPGDFAKKTVLLNSGSEAVETAIKLARSYTGRAGVLVFEGAYHGRTNLTLAMTSKYALFKKGFGPYAPEIYRIPYPNVYRRPAPMSQEQFIDYSISQLENALIAQIDPTSLACVVIEPIQGEGGFIPVPLPYLQRVRELCTQHGIVLVHDEIQCGFGRTGHLFASEYYGVTPDLLVTAKSLAAGMPLAAVTGRADILDAPHPGGLGGTYSGNPLACVAAIEAIQMIRQPSFLARAREVGAVLQQHLTQWQHDLGPNGLIGDVRGVGPMQLMEFVLDRQTKAPAMQETLQITTEALKRGVICIRAGLYSNGVRFLPPLNISDEQLHEGLAVVGQTVRLVDAQVKAGRAVPSPA